MVLIDDGLAEPVHPDMFGGTDEDSHYCAQTKIVVPHTGSARVSRPRGESKQDYCTPRVFLNAVEREFGAIVWDLAATREQKVKPNIGYFGPDAPVPYDNALKVNWSAIEYSGLLWLNPPYSNIKPWAQKAAESGRRIGLLVPASIGANWYWDHVAPYARTFSVGRMMFVIRHEDGSETPACFDKHGKPTNYNKDLMFAVFGMSPGVERWQWKKA